MVPVQSYRYVCGTHQLQHLFSRYSGPVPFSHLSNDKLLAQSNSQKGLPQTAGSMEELLWPHIESTRHCNGTVEGTVLPGAITVSGGLDTVMAPWRGQSFPARAT